MNESNEQKMEETTEKPGKATYKDMPSFLKAHGLTATKGSRTRMRPEDIGLVFDKNHAFYDSRVHMQPDEDFIMSVRRDGVLKPIAVALMGLKPDQTADVLGYAGRQRTKSARLVNEEIEKIISAKAKLGKTATIESVAQETGFSTEVVGLLWNDRETRLVDVNITRVTPETSIAQLVVASIDENWQHPESVMSRAIKVKKALDLGATKDAVRKALRCAPNTIDDLLRFLELSTEVQTAIESGKLPLGTIRTMSEVPQEKQAEVLQQLQQAGATKTHEVKATVAQLQSGASPDQAKVALPDTKKALSRKKMEDFAAAMIEMEIHKDENGDEDPVYNAILFYLGYRANIRKRSMVKYRKAAEMAGIPTRDDAAPEKDETKTTTF